MDPEAARRARRKAIKEDLLEAYTDEEASPPEWLDLVVRVDERTAGLRARVDGEAARFAAEPDIRAALGRRERVGAEVRAAVRNVNEDVRRLNLIAPLPRFHRARLDADDLLRPLYRVRRST